MIFKLLLFIWPDNDEAGYRAAKEVCAELKKVGANEIYISERKELFAKLPPKWNLADPLPKEVERSSLEFGLKSDNKNAFQTRVLHEWSFAEKLQTLDLINTYEEVHQKRLEKEYNRPLPFSERQTIYFRKIHERITFLSRGQELLKRIQTDPDINALGDFGKALAQQVHLSEAKKPLTLDEIETLKKDFENYYPKNFENVAPEIKEVLLSRAFLKEKDPEKGTLFLLTETKSLEKQQ